MNLHSIAYRLIALGIPAPKGGRQWQSSVIGRIIANPCYCGKTYSFHNTIELPDATPPLISEEQFNLAQAKKQRNADLAFRNRKDNYLLSGYVYCKRCGRRYVGIKSSPADPKRYMCSKRKKVYVNRCDNANQKADIIEPLVWLEIERVLKHPDTILAQLECLKGGKSNNFGKELTDTECRLKELDREQEKLLGWALKGFPEKQVERENEKINSSRTELLKRKAELELSIEQAQRAQAQIDNVKEACAIISQNLDSLSYEEKRLALEALNIKVWVDGYNLTLEGILPTEIVSLRP